MNDANKLREMGSPLQDKYIINRMLQTLPESYRHVRSAWTNVPRDEKTIDNLAQRLIAEEGVVASYAVQTPAPPTNSVAFQATVPGMILIFSRTEVKYPLILNSTPFLTNRIQGW
jgi:hypothetical protein